MSVLRILGYTLPVCVTTKRFIASVCVCLSAFPCSFAQLSPILIKTRCEVLPSLFWHLTIYLSDTGSGHGLRKRRADFCFQRTAGNFNAKFLRGKRQGPDPAHLRVLWWNNSKCLSCIVWHAAGGVLKPLLPAPKAPLNKIVKNNSFTLIFPSDYRTHCGKLAAGRVLPSSFDTVTSSCVSASFSPPCSSALLCSLNVCFRSFFLSIPHLSVWQARWTLCGREEWHFIGSVLEATCG